MSQRESGEILNWQGDVPSPLPSHRLYHYCPCFSVKTSNDAKIRPKKCFKHPKTAQKGAKLTPKKAFLAVLCRKFAK